MNTSAPDRLKKSAVTLPPLPEPMVQLKLFASEPSRIDSGATLPGCDSSEFDAAETVGLKNATSMMPAACKVSGFVGLPVMPMPDTVWPAKRCAKLAPSPVTVVPVTAPARLMDTLAAVAGRASAPQAIAMAVSRVFM